MFRTDEDRLEWMLLFDDVVDRHAWLDLFYVQLETHYHVLVEVPDDTLARGMHRLNGGMARAFNRRHGRSGDLVAGRYGAKRVDDELYLLTLVPYLALNPERAGLCRRAEDWRWTNYGRVLAAPEARLTAGDRRLLEPFGGDRATAVARLRALVADARSEPRPPIA